MPNRDAFPAVFAALKATLQPLVPPLVVEADTPDYYALRTGALPQFPAGLFVAAVRQGKSYVSFHLMPIYLYPDLLDGLPDTLRKRRQGKSCFNFSALDQIPTVELAALTRAGFERVRRDGMPSRAAARTPVV
jgi:hypothetical protein